MTIEKYLINNLTRSFYISFYKSYKRAKNHIIKECEKPIKNDFNALVRSNTITIIRNEEGKVLLSCVFDVNKGVYHIIENDNMGLTINKFDIKEGGSKNENK